jgi:hypothetical protein
LAAEFGGVADLAAAEWDWAAGRLTVELFWAPRVAITRALHVSVQLLPAEGETDPRPIAQHDGAPADGRRPTTSWRPGEVVADSHALDLPAPPAAGQRLVVALYDPVTGERLPVQGADADGDVALLEVISR